MEELGIGRPSTYAATMETLRKREYVRLERKRLVPEDKGRIVTAFLEDFFKRYVEFDFTADLEEKLDRISAGELSWRDVLRDFWQDFAANIAQASEVSRSQVIDALNLLLADHLFPPRAEGGDPRECPSCKAGQLSLKLGRYGAFIGCSNYPDCRYTRQLGMNGENGAAAGPTETVVFGDDPETGQQVTLRNGRFGPYVQLGEGEKPKRASIPKGWIIEDLDLDAALKLLRLPREIGIHPETGKPMTAGIGRYGPFVESAGKYANLDSVDEVFTVGANRAVSLLAEKKSGRSRTSASVLKELGEHPTLGGPITVRSGRFGPYVNVAKVNATLPRTMKPEDVTLEQAIELLTEREARGPAKRPARAKKAPAAAKPKSRARPKAKAAAE
jgi:DNA topoisomerase-1